MKSREVGRRALAASVWVGAVTLFQFAVGLAMQVVLARLLAPEVFGAYAFVLLVQGFVASVRTIQAGEFLVCEGEDWRGAYDTVFTVDLGLSALTTVVVVACADPIMQVAGGPGLGGPLAVSILACLVAPFGTVGAAFQRELDWNAISRARVVGIVLGPVVKIGLALHGAGIYSLVIGEVVRQAAELAVMWFSARERPRLALDRDVLRRALAFSLPLSFNGLLTYYYWKVDDLVVGRTLGLTALGHYWLAFRIPEYMMMLKGHFVPVVFSAFARLETLEERKDAFRRLTRLTALLFFPLALVALVLGDVLIVSIFGEAWKPSVTAFQMLMLASALRLTTSYATDLFKVSGRTWVTPVTGTVNAVLLTAGVVALTRPFGITGTGAAVLAMVTLSLPLTEIMLWRWFQESPCRLLVRPVAVLAATVTGGAALRGAVDLSAQGPALAAAVALVAVYAALLCAVDRATANDVRWILASRRR